MIDSEVSGGTWVMRVKKQGLGHLHILREVSFGNRIELET